MKKLNKKQQLSLNKTTLIALSKVVGGQVTTGNCSFSCTNCFQSMAVVGTCDSSGTWC